MEKQKISNLSIENAKLLFRNFSGKEKEYNKAGDRNFCVLFEDEALVDQLRVDGWNIKELKSKDPEEPQKYIMKVSVSYKYQAPNVYLISGGKRTSLDEESLNVLDYAEIKTVDLTISPYQWSVNGKSGIKAYLKSIYITIEEDRFAEKYAELDGQLNIDEDNLPF